jgi:hypothetical protein
MSIVFDGVAANNLDMGNSRNFLRNVAGGTVMGWGLITAFGASRSMISISIAASINTTRTKMTVLTSGAVEIRARALDAQAASDAFDTGATVLTANQRFHIAATVDYSARAGIIYIDGEQAATGVFATMTAGNTSDTVALTGTIGAHENGGSAPWLGQIEDARVYGRILGPAEIKTIVTSRGADGIGGSLQGRWLMNEKAAGQSVALVADLSPNAYALAAAGTSLYAAGTIVSRRRRHSTGRRR